MIRLKTKFAFLLVAVATITLSHAQDRFDSQVADLMLLQAKPIQKAIGVTEAQRAELNKLAAAHRQKVEAFFQEEQKKKVNPATITPSNPTIVGYFAELQAKAFKTLTASQLRRLRELTLQRAGTPAILIPDVSQRLKITSAQTSTIRTAVSSFQTFASTSAQTVANGVLSQYKNVKPKDQADAKRLRAELDSKLRTAETKLHPRIVAAQKIMDRKIELSLSAAQLKAWHSLLGQPFAFR